MDDQFGYFLVFLDLQLNTVVFFAPTTLGPSNTNSYPHFNCIRRLYSTCLILLRGGMLTLYKETRKEGCVHIYALYSASALRVDEI